MTEIYRAMNQERTEQRWQNWSLHRDEINMLISRTLSNTDAETLERVIILGAGNCDDLDVPLFCGMFQQVTLVDVDMRSLHEARNRLPAELYNQIQICGNIDLTKLDQINFYNRFTSLLNDKTTSRNVCLFLEGVCNELAARKVSVQWSMQFPVVISSAVYTQIFYIHALTIFSDHVSCYPPEQVEQIIRCLIKLRDIILIHSTFAA